MNPLRSASDYELFLYTLAQGFPTEPALQSTHPHHKHTPPDIKHHRSPAPTMSFARPNLPILIKEIEDFISDL
jgi:hypothetical protein